MEAFSGVGAEVDVVGEDGGDEAGDDGVDGKGGKKHCQERRWAR